MRKLTAVGVLGAVFSFVSLLMSLFPPKEASQQQGEVDNVFRYGSEKGTWYSDKAGTEVRVEDFDQVGKGAGVIWRGTIPAIVIRADESKLRGATTNNGFIAFASTCTHLCCITTWHQDRPNQDVIFSRCHDGIFDPYDVVRDTMPNAVQYSGARVIGGPPPRPVPIIPIEIKDGKIAGVPKNLQLYGYCE